MDRLAHALPGNCSPQRRQHGSDASETLHSTIPRDYTMGSHGFSHLAESARTRYAAAPVYEGHHGSEPTDPVQPSRQAYDTMMSFDEPRHQVEASRGRRTADAAADGRRGDRFARDGVSSPSRARSSRSSSPNKRSRSPNKAPPLPCSATAESIAERRRDPRPSNINIDTARHFGSVSKKTVVVESRSGHQSHQAATIAPNTPSLNLPLCHRRRMSSPTTSDSVEDEGSSYYSEDEFGQAHPSYISPLRVRKDIDSENNVILQSHSVWAKSASPAHSPGRMVYSPMPRSGSPRRDAGRGLQKTATTGELRQTEPGHQQRNYSPLSDYLSSHAPIHKEMVGKHGWLERTSSPSKESVSEENRNAAQQQNKQQKKKGFLNNLKKIAKDITSDITASASRSRIRDKDPRVSRLTVSLDPREQSLLYCELEFLLTTALDSYINSQFNAGRLDADKYKKVVDGWQQRGRPKVVGFRYDLETQLDLVLLHSEDFRFYGKRAGLIAAVNGVLDMMRVDARAMRIRTFCQPDTVVAKQLLDAQSLFNLVGCCEQQQIQLAEVIQFFKVILEREQNYRAREVEADRPAEDDQQWRASGGTGTDSQAKKSTCSKNSASAPRCSSSNVYKEQ
ncbi:unnamed protein product [Discula destructiva]